MASNPVLGIEKLDDAPAATSPSMMESPSKLRTFLMILALWWTVFLVALDQNIIAPALPAIASDYDSWNSIGYYGSVYLLATCTLQLLYGSLYSKLEVKAVLLCAIVLFEAGSLLCALAPTSNSFIVGRAIAGSGCSGIYSGALICVATYLPVEKRTVYTSVIGTVFAIASVIGPLLGGVFTDGPGWPWCFYVNLPIGGATSAILIFALRKPSSKRHLDSRIRDFLSKTKQWCAETRHKHALRTWYEVIQPFSLFTLVPGLVCLLIALQLGGNVYPWADARIIALLSVAGVLLVIFVGLQISKQWGMIPHSIMKMRGMVFGMLFAFSTSASYFTFTYFLPSWFQLVHGDTAVMSGVHLIPTLVALVVTGLAAAVLTARYGPFQSFLFAASLCMSVSSGFMTTLTSDKDAWFPLGLQILFGVGYGFAVQQPIIIVQNLLDEENVNLGFALMVFSQTLGGAIFVPVAANRFTSSLAQEIKKQLPGQASGALIHGGGPDLNPQLLRSYPQLTGAVNNSLSHAFLVAVPLAAIAALVAIGVRYNRERAQQQSSASAF